jgi:hypothetical protein
VTRRAVIKNAQASKLKDDRPIDDDGSLGGCGATVISPSGHDPLLDALWAHHGTWPSRRLRELGKAED